MTARKDGIFFKTNNMVELKTYERITIRENYKFFSKEDLNYWKFRIDSRLNYLEPLFDEMRRLKIDLRTLSEDLHREIIEIKELRKMLIK